ncbi:Tetraspanin-11 [Abeliophyllum distichum]|uniref:Tetraspanin-11 n=1 Tax=Abeliophyllum distichum TaxID=126358 RepID=A0ABD1PMD0_9LAMI
MSENTPKASIICGFGPFNRFIIRVNGILLQTFIFHVDLSSGFVLRLFWDWLLLPYLQVVVTNNNVGKALSEKGFGEHRLGDYSRWLQNYVINAENWDQIKNCLVDINLCQHLNENKAEVFYKRNMPLIQSGCCKPPAYCGFQSQNATYWIMPKTGPAVPDSDCKTWSNVQKELCFDCESCKLAVLNNIKKDWKIIALINSIILGYSNCCLLHWMLCTQKQFFQWIPEI